LIQVHPVIIELCKPCRYLVLDLIISIMPRIPYIYPAPGESSVADEIRERRKNGKLIALDGVLLNAPAIASGYSSLLGAIRRQSSLDDALRELLVSLAVMADNIMANIQCV
jgi:hypothetical protein